MTDTRGNTMNKVINIHDARIRTVSVGIKALTISDKQVTLAVFRQLFEEDLIAEDGTLNGVPWGRVNYCPNKADCPQPSHAHIVWQKGEELRRGTVLTTPVFDDLSCSEANDVLLTAILEELEKGNAMNIPPPGGKWENLDGALTISRDGWGQYIGIWWWDGIRTKARLDLSFLDKCKDYLSRIDSTATDAAIAAIGSKLADLRPLRNVREILENEKDRRSRWKQNTAAILQLPQLFVAV
jgi:hypothetical protein